MNHVKITNSVYSVDLSCPLDLKFIAMNTRDVVLSNKFFYRLVWRHRRIGGCCMVYPNGKIICHGTSQMLRKYCRLIQKMNFKIQFREAKLVTQAAVYQLQTSPINYDNVIELLQGTYHPEIFHGVEIRRQNVCFLVYSSGKVIITGMRHKDLHSIVLPFLLDLEVAVSC